MNCFENFPLLCTNCIGYKKHISIYKCKDIKTCPITGKKFIGFDLIYTGNYKKKTIISHDFAFIKQICQICLKAIHLDSNFSLKPLYNKKKPELIFENISNKNQKINKCNLQSSNFKAQNNLITTYCGIVTHNIEKIVTCLRNLAKHLNILEISLNKNKNIIYVTFFNIRTNKNLLIYKNLHNLKLFKLQVLFYKEEYNKNNRSDKK
uniref:RNA binding protein n=1 Tax=Lotharella vacuolata TaxID=74820 RepID=A0A0H5BH11_9EUKA|nr:RNA binding protein [Lotharella vacuolata]